MCLGGRLIDALHAVKASYCVVSDSLTHVLPLGLAAPVVLVVFVGAGGAAGLARFGGVAAASAYYNDGLSDMVIFLDILNLTTYYRDSLIVG